MEKNDLNTKAENTWCPGCYDFFIMESVKRAVTNIVNQGTKHEDIAIATGIGCHAKIFDYLNLSGLYCLHGRVLPVLLGMKLGNPNLTAIGFSGDGDTYAEGISHLIHACRYNSNMTFMIFDNQTFALTTGQATPTSEQGFKPKSEPLGVVNQPLNPIKLTLSAGASFVARAYAKDIAHTAEIIEAAIKHKGFSFIEIIQPCLQFHFNKEQLDKSIYKLENHDKASMKAALEKAEEFDYNKKNGKIPTGIFYQKERTMLEDAWPQLKDLKEKNKAWYQIKR